MDNFEVTNSLLNEENIPTVSTNICSDAMENTQNLTNHTNVMVDTACVMFEEKKEINPNGPLEQNDPSNSNINSCEFGGKIFDIPAIGQRMEEDNFRPPKKSEASSCVLHLDEAEDSEPECDKQQHSSRPTLDTCTAEIIGINNQETQMAYSSNATKPYCTNSKVISNINTTSTGSILAMKKVNNSAHHGRYSRNRGGFDGLNVNHSNGNPMSHHPNRFLDYFRSRKISRTAPINSGKRSNHYIVEKTARPTSSKSNSLFRSKQTLLANMKSFTTSTDSGLQIDVQIDSDSKNYNNILPIPVLVHVFSYLPLYDLLCRASRVCRYWYTSVMDPALWRYVNLQEQKRLTDDIFLKLTGISDNILGINLSSSGGHLQSSPDTVTTCLQRSPNLRELKLSRCFDMPAEAFISIGNFCHNLVHLDLDICSNVLNETIIAVGKGCSKLMVLYLGQCSNVKNTGIVEVARGCPLLQQLRIEQCDKITDQGVIELTKYCPDIFYLHMLSCSLTDSSICQLIMLPHLRMLDISNVTQLSPKVLTKVVENCVKLEVLNVSLNRAVDDECIKMIVKSCPKLRILSCVACRLTDKALEYVGEYGQCVEHLDVAWCVDITNYGVQHISDACPSLRYLGLMQCRKVTFDTIDEMIEIHPDIHYSNFVTESRRILKKACMTVDDEFQTLKVLS
ncbi:F-box/LRR-repeat protein 17 [Patella vulgata]|uniref:F-box/LRR-repeat protein 17 n=1 Tax=Patella vulgata TaxID=6465 RepID=UPI00217F5095|nr:F-box/LRR-repeat protein 17 [Patella vulgata]XP_050396340.1 F-box/LRR-repeat protein 17 [Patella vulgata]XP_050396341.1 F-box/LRR-repeat protein 17 [Patella vulgata]XP_050396343.1 F-box/LRR-repeat protein 17 [Patella vulgata]XP_055955781.1 F-box/LRR-repeat protein 17 [Patella vulgata]